MVKCWRCQRNNYHELGGKCDYCSSRLFQPRTQKSKGILALKKFMGSADIVNVYDIIQSLEDLDNSDAPLSSFARPAPFKARHGYIDSRRITSPKQLKDLFLEVMADDPQGELILCQEIESAYNAIWTPGSLVVGKGNDGATLGTGTSTVPLINSLDALGKGILAEAGIKEWPYIELVYRKDTKYPVYTQLRDGPILATVGNYIPSPTVVKTVIHADPAKYKDTVWEKEMEDAKDKDGVVVWYPGGAMTSHFAIHAVLNGLPILFDKEKPDIGSILEPTVDKMIEFDPHAMLKGFVAGNKIPLPINKNSQINMYGRAALVSLHHSMAMGGDASRWVGMSAAVLLRLGIAALNGEARHFGGGGKPARETIYEMAASKSLTFHRSRINRLINIFRYGKWASAGFGGTKWACCGATVADVFNAVYHLALNPTTETASQVVKALNLMVNQAHNGGWWFNKFLPEETFTQISQGEYYHTISAAPAFYELDAVYNNLTEMTVKNETTRMSKWGEVVLSPPRVDQAKIIYSPGINSLEIQITSRLLKKRSRSIHVNDLETLKDIKLKDVRNSLFLVEGKDGYILELRKDNPVVVWQDPSLREMSIKASKQTI